MTTQKCIVCYTDNTTSQPNISDESTFYDCKRCGRFTSSHVDTNITESGRSIISHWIRKQQIKIKRQPNGNNLNNPDISDFFNENSKLKYRDILDSQILIQEKLDSIIFKIGEMSKFAGDTIDSTQDRQKEIAAFSGCVLNLGGNGNAEREYLFLIMHLKDSGLLIVTHNRYQLTKDGFEKYQHLQNQFTKSKKVFMAMQFDQNQNTTSYQAKNYLDMILREEFDLELFSMEHNNQLGNIIEVMKAEINDAKFIICDLSDGNRGAYWEAGYAEGQKKKVIYICDEEIFGDEESRKQGGERKIHFDIKSPSQI